MRTDLRSDIIKKGLDRAPQRSLLKALGLREEDFDKPFVGIANSFVEIIPQYVQHKPISNESSRRRHSS